MIESVGATLSLQVDLSGAIHIFRLRDLDVRNPRQHRGWEKVGANKGSLTHSEKIGRSLEFLDRPGQQPPFAEP